MESTLINYRNTRASNINQDNSQVGTLGGDFGEVCLQQIGFSDTEAWSAERDMSQKHSKYDNLLLRIKATRSIHN
jgi:hypothetical protein